jgi:eukaryotic-like serine/threonine-protein kinase
MFSKRNIKETRLQFCAVSTILIVAILGVGCQKNPLSIKWHKRFKDSVFSPFSGDVVSSIAPVINNGVLYFGTDRGNLVAFDLSKKSTLWKVKTKNPVESEVLAEGENIYFGNSEGFFYSVDRKSGSQNWVYRTSGEIYAKPEFNPDGMVYFATADGVVNALDAKSGEWQWHYKRTLPDKVSVKGVSSPRLIGKEMLLVGFADGYL